MYWLGQVVFKLNPSSSYLEYTINGFEIFIMMYNRIRKQYDFVKKIVSGSTIVIYKHYIFRRVKGQKYGFRLVKFWKSLNNKQYRSCYTYIGGGYDIDLFFSFENIRCKKPSKCKKKYCRVKAPCCKKYCVNNVPSMIINYVNGRRSGWQYARYKNGKVIKFEL